MDQLQLTERERLLIAQVRKNRATFVEDNPNKIYTRQMGRMFLDTKIDPTRVDFILDQALGLARILFDEPSRHGHPRFYELTRAEEDLHSRKNEDYAGGGPPMGNFERVAKFFSMYPGFSLDTPHGVAIVYFMKQLDAALWLLATKREGKVEGVAERLSDLSVYAKLARIMYEESNAKDS